MQAELKEAFRLYDKEVAVFVKWLVKCAIDKPLAKKPAQKQISLQPRAEGALLEWWGVGQATPRLCFSSCPLSGSSGQGIEQAGEYRAVMGTLGEGCITSQRRRGIYPTLRELNSPCGFFDTSKVSPNPLHLCVWVQPYSLFDSTICRSSCVAGNGYITTQVLREILAALDDALKPEDLDGIIAEIDTDGSGTVDFDEFMEMMTGE
ncbi:hypothetical protein J6590_002892 [Homalodisca vitripennis]|nr:hypothetical protein J6590_002892 [Homalodisca vitripennis]